MQAPTAIGQVFQHTIRAYDIDSNKQATPLSLIKIMHESAMQNVIRIGISVWDLEPRHLTWILTNQYVSIKRLPILGEEITIVTYPSGFEKVFTYRDYKIFDKSGNLIISSSTTWLLMDTKERKMTRIPADILTLRNDLPAPEICLPRCDFKIKTFNDFDTQQTFQVGWHDLDFNNHANNVQYVRWMLEPIGKVLKTKQLKRLEIQFRAECYWQNELLASARAEENMSYTHQLTKKDGQKILALARTFWE